MNKVILTGRLAVDPEMRYTTNGVACTKFRIAVSKDYKDKDGKVGADFLNVIAWRSTAERISKLLKKGMRIGLEGRLQSNSYENNDGSRVYATDIELDRFEFLDNKKTDEPVTSEDPFEDFSDSVTLDDNDLPF